MLHKGDFGDKLPKCTYWPLGTMLARASGLRNDRCQDFHRGRVGQNHRGSTGARPRFVTGVPGETPVPKYRGQTMFPRFQHHSPGLNHGPRFKTRAPVPRAPVRYRGTGGNPGTPVNPGTEVPGSNTIPRVSTPFPRFNPRTPVQTPGPGAGGPGSLPGHRGKPRYPGKPRYREPRLKPRFSLGKNRGRGKKSKKHRGLPGYRGRGRAPVVP